MAIKTLLVAGVATLGLCSGAFAQTQTAPTTQSNTSTQAAAAFGGTAVNVQKGVLALQSQRANANASVYQSSRQYNTGATQVVIPPRH